jgi:hypothetical protein
MKPFIARAVVFLNDNFMKIATQSTGMIAYGEPDAPPHYLPPDANDATVGQTLRMALKASKQVGLEEFQRIWNSGMLKKKDAEYEIFEMEQYGFKTKRALYRRMLICTVEMIGERIDIYPTHHKGLGAYSGISNDGPEILHIAELTSEQELGASIREGLKRSTCTG